MKRTVFDLLLVIALGAAAAFGWLRYQAGAAAAAQVAELTPQTAGAVTKLAEAEATLEQVQAELAPLREQAEQLSVYKSVFSNGDLLRDLEAAYRKEKAPLSPERQLGLGTLRLLTKGSADAAAVDAFTRALDTADWGSRKAVICAAQNALASAGQKVEVLQSCQQLAQSPPASAETPSQAQAQSEPAGAAEAKAADAPKSQAERRLEEAARQKSEPKPGAGLPPWAFEGPLGPENWGERYAMCARGRNQAPINIAGPLMRVKYDLVQDYRNGPLAMVNDGKTVVVNVSPGSRMRIDSLPYELLSLTFQRPSGEQIDGKPAPMGIHFLHRDLNGKMVTVVVLLKEGNENPGIKLLWSHMPGKEGPEVKPEGVTFNPANLLPRDMKFFRYDGSLSTPPCSENMRYYVLKEPVNISREQILQFPYKVAARPVQPQNGRPIATN
ncbi:MAG: Carbonic anhydrase precursor [Pseudomonadota bacterium]